MHLKSSAPLLTRGFFSLSILMMSVMLSWSNDSGDENYEQIKALNHTILVRESDQEPITGINVTQMLQPILPIINELEDNGLHLFGNIGKWNFSTYLPKFNGDYVKYKEETAKVKFVKNIDVQVGVYKDHKTALEAANISLRSCLVFPQKVVQSADDPGYVGWNYGSGCERFKAFVRDNVLIFVVMRPTEEYSADKVAQLIDKVLLERDKGVSSGAEVPELVISDTSDAKIPEVAFIGNKHKFPAALQLRKSQSVKVKDVDFNAKPLDGTDPEALMEHQDFSVLEIPNLGWDWTGDGTVYVTMKAKRKQRLELYAIAIDENCVVSNFWSKKVTFIPSGE